jgi:hypothetical protein
LRRSIGGDQPEPASAPEPASHKKPAQKAPAAHADKGIALVKSDKDAKASAKPAKQARRKSA